MKAKISLDIEGLRQFKERVRDAELHHMMNVRKTLSTNGFNASTYPYVFNEIFVYSYDISKSGGMYLHIDLDNNQITFKKTTGHHTTVDAYIYIKELTEKLQKEGQR